MCSSDNTIFQVLPAEVHYECQRSRTISVVLLQSWNAPWALVLMLGSYIVFLSVPGWKSLGHYSIEMTARTRERMAAPAVRSSCMSGLVTRHASRDFATLPRSFPQLPCRWGNFRRILAFIFAQVFYIYCILSWLVLFILILLHFKNVLKFPKCVYTAPNPFLNEDMLHKIFN